MKLVEKTFYISLLISVPFSFKLNAYFLTFNVYFSMSFLLLFFNFCKKKDFTLLQSLFFFFFSCRFSPRQDNIFYPSDAKIVYPGIMGRFSYFTGLLDRRVTSW